MHWLIVGLLILIFLALTGGGQIARRLMSFLWCIALLLFVAVASGDPIYVFKGIAIAFAILTMAVVLMLTYYWSRDGFSVSWHSNK
ncbi:MAG: hypothetical protein CMM61_17455 [Rhodospirillaceae bacterium]|nr:hypothetical protein [Rhodospirillaceae bacterium]